MVLTVVVLLGVFAWLTGALRPFSHTVSYHLLYGFAGGVEEGSSVRVAGVKVGRVDSIQFVPTTKTQEGEEPAALLVTISVSKKAAPSVRKDSKFYINMAGVIGERYIEISPGASGEELLAAGSTVRGVDPPRVDQLLSQGYGLFGKLQEFIDKNEKSLSDLFDSLSAMLERKDWKKLLTLIDNVNAVTSDVKILTKKIRTKEMQLAIDNIYEMINRAHSIDQQALKKFLQEEGIRARIF